MVFHRFKLSKDSSMWVLTSLDEYGLGKSKGNKNKDGSHFNFFYFINIFSSTEQIYEKWGVVATPMIKIVIIFLFRFFSYLPFLLIYKRNIFYNSYTSIISLWLFFIYIFNFELGLKIFTFSHTFIWESLWSWSLIFIIIIKAN